MSKWRKAKKASTAADEEMAVLVDEGSDGSDSVSLIEALPTRMLHHGLPTMPETSANVAPLFRSVSGSDLMSSTKALPSKLLLVPPSESTESFAVPDAVLDDADRESAAIGDGADADVGAPAAGPPADTSVTSALVAQAQALEASEQLASAQLGILFNTLLEHYRAILPDAASSAQLVQAFGACSDPVEMYATRYSPLVVAAQVLPVVAAQYWG